MVMLNSEHDQDVLLGGWDSSCMLALGAGYMVVSQFGDTWWSAVPKALDNKLRGRQRELPPVDYVALGPDNSYFVQVGRVHSLCRCWPRQQCVLWEMQVD